MPRKKLKAIMGRLISDADSGGGGSQRQRPALQRAGGERFTPSTVAAPNISTASIAASSDGASSDIDPPPKDHMRTTTAINSRRSVFVREQTLRKLQEMQHHLDRSSIDATNSVYAAQLGEEEKTIDLVSSLQDTNSQNEDTIQDLRQQLSEMESQNEFVKADRQRWKKKHARMERHNYELVEKMAAKALEQLKSHSNTLKAETDDWKEKYEQMGQLYDELVENIGGLADENGQLLIKCQQLEVDEKKYKEELAMMEDLQGENDALHQSMEEAMKLATGMSEKMASFVQAHVVSVKGYEEKLASLNVKLNQAALPKEERSTALRALKEEHEVLRTQFKEAENCYEQDLMELGAETALKEENKVLRTELEEAKEAKDYYKQELIELDAEKETAYQTCEVLQLEINLLSKALETKENNLAERTKTSDDVGPRGKVPTAAQSTHGNLNEEQTMSTRTAPSIAPNINNNEGSTLQQYASILPQYGCYDYDGMSECVAIADEAEREAAARMRKRIYERKG